MSSQRWEQMYDWPVLYFPSRPALRPLTHSLVRTASAVLTWVHTISTTSHRLHTAPTSTCSRCTVPSSSTLCTQWCLPPGALHSCLILKHLWWEHVTMCITKVIKFSFYLFISGSVLSKWISFLPLWYSGTFPKQWIHERLQQSYQLQRKLKLHQYPSTKKPVSGSHAWQHYTFYINNRRYIGV